MSNKRTRWQAPVGKIGDAPRFGASQNSAYQFSGWKDVLSRPLTLFLISVLLLMGTVTVKFWKEGRFDHLFGQNRASEAPRNDWMLGGSAPSSHTKASEGAQSEWVEVEENELATAVDQAQAAADLAAEAEVAAAE